MTITIQPCIDRTDTGTLDLATIATTTFAAELQKTKEFSVSEDGDYLLSCEVTNYAAGSAFKRWLMPGWGASVGQVAAMIEKRDTGETLVIIEGNATVGAGGLYTIGAENYIVPSAVEDVVRQMRDWAGGEDTGT